MKNLKQLSKLFLLFFLMLSTNGCDDFDDNLRIANAEELIVKEPILKEVITKDSELFKLISLVAKEENEPQKDTVCIEFVYPLHLLIYNSNLQPINSTTISDNKSFSAFLENLDPAQSLSISYPISTTIADGSVFSVNNNSELKLAIDSCSREDIINYYFNIFSNGSGSSKCIWKVQYKPDGDNKYLSGYFDANSDGTIKFYYDEQEYLGSWFFLFVNDELHININLEGTSQIALDWNIDRKVILNGEEIKIINPPLDINLKRACYCTEKYEIGATGPAGGIVFYDKGSYTDGWRYLEVATQDLSIFEWGCLGSDIAKTNSASVGKGLINSGKIINYHDALINYYENPSVCNSLNNGTVVANEALAYTFNGYDDWFLPSIEELDLMYQNLHLQSLGNMSNSVYWSSTQFDADNAKSFDFTTGTVLNIPKNETKNIIKARTVRYF